MKEIINDILYTVDKIKIITVSINDRFNFEYTFLFGFFSGVKTCFLASKY